MAFRITEIYAVVATDEDGVEGVVAITTPSGGAMPLIAADEARLKNIVPAARSIARLTGHTYKLIRVTQREDVMDITGQDVS